MLRPKLTITGEKDFKQIYDGYDDTMGAHTLMNVGIGTDDRQIYATPAYQKGKRSTLIYGALNSIIYSGMEHDKEPLILPFYYEPQYNTVMAYNLHYIPPRMRAQMLDFIIRMNIGNIKHRLPLVIDYHAVKRAFPWSQTIVRRYKRTGIAVLSAHPIVEWQDLIKKSNRWQNWWSEQSRKRNRGQRASVLNRIADGARKIFKR